MQLDNKNSVFNMGDTSIRVKQTVEVNKIILKHLNDFLSTDVLWNKNKDAQEDFYRSFINEIVKIEENDGVELFTDFKRAKNYTPPKKNKVGLRARTLTNALVKIGLIDSNRKTSEIGRNYLNNSLKEADKFENLLSLSSDNLLYLRQFLKLRIYSSDSNKYFYNFRFAIKFLSVNKDVPQDHFLKIVESIRPEQSNTELEKLIDTYREVSLGNISFDSYYSRNFINKLKSEEEIEAVKKMFSNKDFSDENFKIYFPNSKSGDTSLLYKEFVLTLMSFNQNHSVSELNKLKNLSKDPKIKKAFSGGKLPFVFTKPHSVNNFLRENKDNPLLSQDDFDIYLEFVFSKHNDLIKEYSDMSRRAFQITGIISFENKLANLTNEWIISPLLEIIGDKFELTGDSSYSEYEIDPNSIWFSDISTMEILNITESEYTKLMIKLASDFGEADISKIPQRIIEEREHEYRNFVYSNFPKEKVVDILRSISNRDDSYVYEKVTDTATVPTIYEYILTIAWFYLSKDKDYYLHKSFGVSLDGNKLPLVHQGGGKGDIEIISDRYSLLIEATLMDLSTQRRGELEPVIRHSINFAIENKEAETQTIFIANELDNNVLNIFRATQFIELNGTLETTKTINGLNIFALTTNEVIDMINSNIYDYDILRAINANLSESPEYIKNNWKLPILNSIFNN